MKTEVLFVGAGGVARKRAQNLPKDFVVAGVYDPKSDQAQSFSENFGGVIFDSEQALMSYDAQIVVIATFHSELARVATVAMKNNFDVLIEKPGAISSNQIKALQATQHEFGSRVVVGFNHRHHPAIKELIQATKQKKYGQLRHVRLVYGHGGRKGYEKEWRFSKELGGGGELLDQGSHAFDILHQLDDSWSVKFAKLSNRFWKGPVEDSANVFLESSRGAEAIISVSWAEWKNIFRLEALYEFGKIQIDGLGGSYGIETIREWKMDESMNPPILEQKEFAGPDASWGFELEFLRDQERQGLTFPSGASLSDAYKVFQTVEESRDVHFKSTTTN